MQVNTVWIDIMTRFLKYFGVAIYLLFICFWSLLPVSIQVSEFAVNIVNFYGIWLAIWKPNKPLFDFCVEERLCHFMPHCPSPPKWHEAESDANYLISTMIDYIFPMWKRSEALSMWVLPTQILSSTRGIFRNCSNIYDGVLEKISNALKQSTIFAKQLHHKCLSGS